MFEVLDPADFDLNSAVFSRNLERRYVYGGCQVVLNEWIPREGPHQLLRAGVPNARKTLLFLHGRFDDSKTWVPAVARLSNQYRCIALDLPGFGKSFSVRLHGLSLMEHANVVEQIVKISCEEDCILVGHDLGGAIAAMLAIRSPELFSGLVLLNSALPCQRVSRTSTPLGGLFGWFRTRRVLKKLLKESEGLQPELKRALLEPWKRLQTRASRLKSLQILDENWPGHYERQLWKSRLSKISCPTLLLWGARDGLNYPENSIELGKILPESYIYEHSESGHWLHLEQPGWVSSKIREFLFRLSQVRPTFAQKSLSR